MSQKDKVLVIFDLGVPTTLNQDFSEELKTKEWKTESNVLKALKKNETPFEYLGIHDDLSLITQKIDSFQPTVIFNLVESFRGQLHFDRDIASYFKLLDIPFTGCGPTGLTLCKHKGFSKQILRSHRIRVPQFVVLKKKTRIHRPKRLHFPILIKPLNEEASYGISQASFVENDKDFRERVAFIHQSMDQDAIAEEYIEGRELYVSIIGNKRLEVFPFRELTFSQIPDDEPKIATYKSKWDEQYRKRWGIRNQFANPLSAGLKEKIEKTCKKIYQLLFIRGYARIDLRLTPEDEIVFLEANPNPILASEEDFAESAAKAGLSYPDLIQKIINLSKRNEGD